MNRIKWSELKAEKLDRPHTRNSNGMKLEVSLSPYDIPKAARGYYCKEHEKYIIEFRYLTEEETKKREAGEHTTLFEGKNSGRLYAIHCDVKAMQISELEVAFRLVKNDFYSPSNPNPRSQKNRRLLEAYEDDIINNATRELATC